MAQSDHQPQNVEFAPLGILSPNGGGKTIDIVKFTLSIWKPLVVGLALGIGAGIAAYLYLGPTYQAMTRVEVAQKSAIPTDDRTPNFSGERTEHVHLIMSDAIVGRAVSDHGLKDLPEFAGAGDPVLDILDSLTAKRSAGQDTSFVNIIDIAYIHPDKHVARTVVDAVVNAYRDYLDVQRQQNSSGLYDSLQARQAELESDIESLQSAYHLFRDDAPYYLATPPTVSVNGNVIPGKNPYQARVEKVREDIGKNMLRQSEISSRIATLEQLAESGESQEALEFFITYWLTAAPSSTGEQGGGGGGNLLTEPAVQADLDRRYLELHLLLDRLRVQLGEDHVNVRKLRHQIDTLMQFYDQKSFTPPAIVEADSAVPSERKSQRRDLVAAYKRILQQDLVHLQDLDERLKADLADAEDEAKRAALFEVEDQRRKDEIARKKDQWKTVTTELETFGVRKEQEGYRVEQIAQVRVEQSMKRMMKIVGAFGVLGIAAVFALSYFREWSDTRIRSVDELREVVDATVLGEVPGFAHAAVRSGFDGRLCYFHRPASREAEAFRTVRASLLHSHTGEGGRVIQVSSPEPGDGKSVSAANLALALAQSGKRVLLVDADLRRPTVHSLFRVPQEIGLADVLRRELQWPNALRPTQIDGLSLMTAGECPDNPAELLIASDLRGILHGARDEFDFVIVDTPPILAVSDPAVIAPETDGMLLVVRMQKNKRGALKRTLTALDAHGATIIGVVANDVDPALDDYRSADYDAYYRAGGRGAPAAASAEPVAETALAAE